MSKRLPYRFSIAIATAVLLTLCMDLLRSVFTIGARLAIDDMATLLAFLFRSAVHFGAETAPAIAGLLVSAGLIFVLVRRINQSHDSRTAKRPSTPPA